MLAGAHFLALLSPGPDFFLLVGGMARHGVRYSLGAAVGIALANAGYIACALAGFSLLRSQPLVHAAMHWLGALYLGWLGACLLRSAATLRDVSVGARRTDARGFGAGWLAGFLSGALNPKNGLFYLGLFSLVVSPRTPAGVRGFYGAWMFAVVLVWDVLLVVCLRATSALATVRRHERKIESLSGACLLALAVLIASGAW